MKWVAVIVLVVLGMVELILRGVALLALVASLMGLLVIETARREDFAESRLWSLAERLALSGEL